MTIPFKKLKMLATLAELEEPNPIGSCALCAPPIGPADIESLQAKYSSVVKELGKGSYGQVRLVEDPDTGDQAALKIESLSSYVVGREDVGTGREQVIKHTDAMSDSYVREVTCLAALAGQPHIIQMLGFKIDDKKNLVYLEAARESLHSHLRRVKRIGWGATDIDAKGIMYQILRGAAVMHAYGIMHRDLKPGNVLMMEDGEMKIADFGLAKGGPFGLTPLTDHVFTLWYRPPEILMRQIISKALPDGVVSQYYGLEADIYSVGMIFWDILTAGDTKVNREMKADTNDAVLQFIKVLRLFPADEFNFCEPFNRSYRKDCKEHVHDAVKLLTRKTPKVQRYVDNLFYYERSNASTYKKIKSFFYTKPAAITDEAIDLLLKLLHPNPSKRITLQDAMDHSFFDDVRDRFGPLQLPSAPFEMLYFNALEHSCSKHISPFFKPSAFCDDDLPPNCQILSAELSITDYTRAAKWLYNLSKIFYKETYYLALQLLRCELSRNLTIEQGDLQGVATGCFIISQYYNEITPWYEYDFIEYNEGTNYDMNIEKDLVQVFYNVGGMVYLPTSYVYLRQILDEEETDWEDIGDNDETFEPILLLLESSEFTWNNSPHTVAETTYKIWNGGKGLEDEIKRQLQEIYNSDIPILNTSSKEVLKNIFPNVSRQLQKSKQTLRNPFLPPSYHLEK